MKTCCFRLYTGPGRISIARWAPRNTPVGYRVYRPLAPGDWSRVILPSGRTRFCDDASFAAGYAAQLAALDPQQVWRDLHNLAGHAEPVLLCWEVPPFTSRNWCHRRTVAEWFQRTLGVEVAEWLSGGG
jgi:hypothetical protein